MPHLIRSGGNLGGGLGNKILSSGSVNVSKLVNLLGQDLDRSILVDGHGSRGHEELVGGAILLVHSDYAGLEDSKSGNMVGEDTKGSREGRNINL